MGGIESKIFVCIYARVRMRMCVCDYVLIIRYSKINRGMGGQSLRVCLELSPLFSRFRAI